MFITVGTSVVSHSYGGLSGGRDRVAVGKQARQSQEGLFACW